MRVKICGIKDEAARDAAVEAGAAYIGFMFFPKSPRNVSVEQACALASDIPPGLCKVAVLVDPDEAQLEAILSAVPIDLIQLSGKETPERVAEIRQQTGLPVMKAVSIATAGDLAKVDSYAGVADQILVDAKPPKDSKLPGGNGLTFDWNLLIGHRWSVPWMLAGGLNAGNVGEAIRLTGAQQLDLSSGVESAPGVKDPALIRDFMAAATKDTVGAASA